jgi:diguanylate cyclase (GGDEF)-like protein
MRFPELASLDRRLGGLPPVWIAILAAFGVGIVGLVDFLTGYEIALSILYLGPVGMAAWYGKRRAGIWIAALSCAAWFAADVGVGHVYSHLWIPAWNALVRLGFFLIVALLVDALHARLSTAQWLATNDPLTGLLNSRGFAERLEYVLALARRNRTPISLAYLDVDDFKRINDRDGHDAGDRLLQDVAAALRKGVRNSDAVARLGGDEFALLLPDTDEDGAQLLMSKLTEALLHSTRSGQTVGCSVGVATFIQPPDSAEQAIKAADHLMYGVKNSGKNAVAYRSFDSTGAALPPASAVTDTHSLS